MEEEDEESYPVFRLLEEEQEVVVEEGVDGEGEKIRGGEGETGEQGGRG